jgi:hypothetical protein
MIFDFVDGKVELLPEAMTLPEVKVLWDEDKTRGKQYFHLYITYIFFVYRIDGIYKNMYLTSRKRQACVNQLKKPEDYWQEIESKPTVAALIKWYNDNSKTKEEQLLEALDEDIDKYIEYLKNIPYARQVRVEEKQGDGEIVVSYKSSDNSDEKMKAIRNSKDLILYRKELKKMVKDSGVNKKRAKQFRTRIFEE